MTDLLKYFCAGLPIMVCLVASTIGLVAFIVSFPELTFVLLLIVITTVVGAATVIESKEENNDD